MPKILQTSIYSLPKKGELLEGKMNATVLLKNYRAVTAKINEMSAFDN